jgi:sarcosine oxidase, subunit beta
MFVTRVSDRARKLSHSPLRGGRVVIIGGGVVGLSIAYHLTAHGYQDVTLVERRVLGSGATSKGTGGIRQQFSSGVNIALSRRAVDYFAGFRDRVGESARFRQHGYLFLLDRAEQLEAFRENAAKQLEAGVPVQLLEPEEIPGVMPHVNVDGLLAASYCRTDGSASPEAVAKAFARGARAHGARLMEDTTVIAIEQDTRGAVGAVDTTRGRLAAEAVVNAAGAWAAEVGRLAGIELPIVPYRRQAFEVSSPAWLDADLPLTVDLASGAYVHPRPGGSVIGGTDRNVPAGFDEEVDWSLVPALREALARRIPRMTDAGIIRGWAGLRDMTPDEHAIVGPVAAVPGFWTAAGFSGHGFMHSPVVGELLSEWLVDGAPTLDLSALRPERFDEGADASETETTVF